MSNDEDRERLEDEAAWDEERAFLRRRLDTEDFNKNEELLYRDFMKQRSDQRVARRAADAVERSAAEAAKATKDTKSAKRLAWIATGISAVAAVFTAWPVVKEWIR